jgi:hypothetical protein
LPALTYVEKRLTRTCDLMRGGEARRGQARPAFPVNALRASALSASVVVQHVQVSEGGQAIVAGEIKAGGRRKRGDRGGGKT